LLETQQAKNQPIIAFKRAILVYIVTYIVEITIITEPLSDTFSTTVILVPKCGIFQPRHPLNQNQLMEERQFYLRVAKYSP